MRTYFMIDTFTFFRFLILFLLGFGSFILAVKLIKPPKRIMCLAMKFCWVAGILNFFVDIIQQHYGFWHYTASNLVYGYPVDLYVAVSLAIGGAFPIVYWWLRSFHKGWVMPVVFILNFYFVLEDSIVLKLGGNAVGVIDNRYWWIADFFALGIMLWGTLFVFNYFLRQNGLSKSSKDNVK